MITILTERLILASQTRDQALCMISNLSPEDRLQVSDDWLALLDRSGYDDPWVHGFSIVLRSTNEAIGSGGFKGPPGVDGAVEISYGINTERRNRGYATEAAAALVDFAFEDDRVRVVRAHTLAEPNASSRALTKCGFLFVGEVIDPEDGLVWRWEKPRLYAGGLPDAVIGD